MPGGRPKGSSEIAPKIRHAINDAIAKMKNRTGKTLGERLTECLDDDPISTLNMVARYMPKEIEVSGKNGGPIEVTELSREERINRLTQLINAGSVERTGLIIDSGDADLGADTGASD